MQRILNIQVDRKSLNVEHEYVNRVVEMQKFKMNKITSMIKECMNELFASNIFANRQTLLNNCVGKGYQILLRSHSEAKQNIKRIFFQILENKFDGMDPAYEDEVQYFLDILENFLEKDYDIEKSLKIAKKGAKYYVSEVFFNYLVEMCQEEIDAIKKLEETLTGIISEQKKWIDEKMAPREKEMATLVGAVDQQELENQIENQKEQELEQTEDVIEDETEEEENEEEKQQDQQDEQEQGQQEQEKEEESQSENENGLDDIQNSDDFDNNKLTDTKL